MRYLLIVLTLLIEMGCQERVNQSRLSGFREYSGSKYVFKGSPVAHRLLEAHHR